MPNKPKEPASAEQKPLPRAAVKAVKGFDPAQLKAAKGKTQPAFATRRQMLPGRSGQR